MLLLFVLRQRRQIRELSHHQDRATESAKTPAAGAGNRGTAKADVGSDVLFATLSHELRTPLNGLLGIVQILNEEREDEDFVAIEGCARHMLAVISTLVNHSKIQAEWDDLPEYREWVSPFEMFEQIKRHLDFRAGLRGLNIKLVHQDKRLRLRGDYDHLRNIVENTILGSLEAISLVEIPSDRKTLTVSWEASDGEVRVSVYNPLEIFSDDRREQIRTAGGLTTGERLPRIKMEYLYWSVASMLLEKYGGALFSKVHPVEGGVTTLLSFEMEQMQASPSEKLPVGGLSLESENRQPKSVKQLPFKLSILVAEDDPVARSLMASVLKHMGQESHFATNGREVLDLVSQSKTFDLILMDIDMPIMDGLSASIALRNGEAGELGTQIPIVAVTAFNTLSDESRFKKAGMNYFLPKPVKLQHLRDVLLEVVRSE
ncbi:response regulator [Coraliomargarita sp. SDUM461004]|uniref:histidine kinase n=1 Tax=Thalassobacterium sedimentorum TaxID=3041258 RepID=A0ABU1AFG4_9BACT|nr:response regulator [Coraliomargarita sp. SDUM461004]MDQ8193550.1 response regulator [Coraliomargarita sp. SDUM461004]